MTRAALGLVGLLLLACSGSSSGDGGGGSNYASKRSSTCSAWQDSMCDFVADKCQAQARADCDELYQSLFCKDDATMQTCIGTLSAATCPTPFTVPEECKQINDPAPVGAYCQEFARAVCKFGVRCKETSDQAGCEAQVAVELASTCNAGVGLSPTADQCLADLGTLACGQQAPPSCSGVIKVLSSSPSADVVVPWGTFTLAEPRLVPSPAAFEFPPRR